MLILLCYYASAIELSTREYVDDSISRLRMVDDLDYINNKTVKLEITEKEMEIKCFTEWGTKYGNANTSYVPYHDGAHLVAETIEGCKFDIIFKKYDEWKEYKPGEGYGGYVQEMYLHKNNELKDACPDYFNNYVLLCWNNVTGQIFYNTMGGNHDYRCPAKVTLAVADLPVVDRLALHGELPTDFINETTLESRLSNMRNVSNLDYEHRDNVLLYEFHPKTSHAEFGILENNCRPNDRIRVDLIANYLIGKPTCSVFGDLENGVAGGLTNSFGIMNCSDGEVYNHDNYTAAVGKYRSFQFSSFNLDCGQGISRISYIDIKEYDIERIFAVRESAQRLLTTADEISPSYVKSDSETCEVADRLDIDSDGKVAPRFDKFTRYIYDNGCSIYLKGRVASGEAYDVVGRCGYGYETSYVAFLENNQIDEPEIGNRLIFRDSNDNEVFSVYGDGYVKNSKGEIIDVEILGINNKKKTLPCADVDYIAPSMKYAMDKFAEKELLFDKTDNDKPLFYKKADFALVVADDVAKAPDDASVFTTGGIKAILEEIDDYIV